MASLYFDAQPSVGRPAPSRADIEMTKEIVETGKRLGIAVHDHIIIGRKGYASMKGLLLI
jgi:DNA repair protein RadC